MAICPYNSTQSASLAELFEAANFDLHGIEYSPLQLRAWTASCADLVAWQQSLATATVWLETQDERIVGFIRVESDGYIDPICVHPAWQHQGIGTRLLQQAIAWGRRIGLRDLLVDARPRARRFFEKQGFVAFGPRRVERQGVLFDCIALEHVL